MLKPKYKKIIFTLSIVTLFILGLSEGVFDNLGSKLHLYVLYDTIKRLDFTKPMSNQEITKKFNHNPDLIIPFYTSIKRYNNYYCSTQYQDLAKKYQRKFDRKNNLNPIAKMRFVSAYAVYNINHQTKTNIENNTIHNQF